MSRKDYIAIADSLNNVWQYDVIPMGDEKGNKIFDKCVEAVSDMLRRDNFRFNSDRFYDAVYKEDAR